MSYNGHDRFTEGTRAVEIQWILELVLFAILHWALAGIILNDIAHRKKVLGGHKAPWVIVVIIVTFVGSLAYLLCHPQILGGDEDR